MTEGQALGTLNLTPSGFYPVGEQIHSRDCYTKDLWNDRHFLL